MQAGKPTTEIERVPDIEMAQETVMASLKSRLPDRLKLSALRRRTGKELR
jgi:hypothetical protein